MKKLLILFSLVSSWLSVQSQLAAPFYEQVNTCSLPVGWTTQGTVWKATGVMGYDAGNVSDHSNIPGSCFIWADGSNYGSSAGQVASLETDSIDMSSLTNPQLTFYLSSYNPSYTVSNGNNTFSIDFYDGTTWHDSIYGHSGNLTDFWNLVTIPLSSYTVSGNVVFRFNVTNTSTGSAIYNDIALDDIRLDDVPTCPVPSSFTSSASAPTSSTLSWVSGGASSWQVEYGPVGHSAGSGTIVAANTNNNYILGSLTPGTIFDFYVRDYCSSTDQSYWVGPIKDTTLCSSALSGTYTLDQGSAASTTNFTSLQELASSLTLCGVSGPVTINIVTGSGPYNEQVEFQMIPGASSSKNVTINGNGESISDDGTVGGNYATVLLNGTDHLIIDSLHIQNTSTANAVGLQFMNEADSNIFRNSKIQMVDIGTASSIYGITFSASATSLSSSGNNGNYNLFEGNEISGGYYGMRVYGSSSVPVAGNIALNNTIRDFRYGGLYFYYTSNSVIKGNDVHRLNRSDLSAAYAVYVGYSSGGQEISYNWVHDLFAQASSSTQGAYGFYINGSDNSTTDKGYVYNNLVTKLGGEGNHWALYHTGSDNWAYFHNTLSDDGYFASGTAYSRMAYFTGSDGIEFSNNMLFLNRSTTGSHHLIYLSNSASNITMDNNAYYFDPSMTTANFGYDGTYDIADLPAWQAVSNAAYDQNSAFGNPFFVNAFNDDYTPTAAYFNDIGANLQSIVSDDIYGAARSATPDPGAIEFIPPPGPDMAVLNVYSNGAACGASTSIIVEVLSQGTDTVTSFTLNYEINSVPQTPINLTGSWETGAIDSILISGIPINSTSITQVEVEITSVAPSTETDLTNNEGMINLRQGLSGTFTIDQSGALTSTNFVSFTALAEALSNYGVCGNVIVNVAGTANTYIEKFLLDEIIGASSTATITINGNGNNIQYLATGASDLATITLNGTDWITIDSLNIEALGNSSSEYGFGISITNNANHNTIRHCRIQVSDNQTSSSYAGIAISGSVASYSTSGQSGNYNLIEGNIIIGGYCSISCVGEVNDSANFNIIRNNVMEDFYQYGGYLYYNRNLEFTGNDLSRSGRTNVTTFYPLRAYYGMSIELSGNKIHDGFNSSPSSTSLSYGMYLSALEGTAAAPSTIANNIIYNMQSDGTVYGAYYSNLSNTLIAHNSFILEDNSYGGTSSPFCRAVYFASSMNDVEFSNNLIYYDFDAPSSSNSYVVYTSTYPTKMDNNAYYTGTNATFDNFAYASNTGVATFADWQTASLLDTKSQLANPFFVDMANGDFTPQSAALDGLGEDLTSFVSSDINGTTRGLPTDPGAIEFVGAPCTGLSGIMDTVTSNSTTVMWDGPGQNVDIIWGPVGFLQASAASDTVHVTAIDTNGTILGMNSNTCYEYYLQLTCTSTIPGAPELMGPYVVCTDCAGGGLNGVYTVGGTPGPRNFATLDSVITALHGCGLAGPATFNLQGGLHDGFTLGRVAGSSSTNTITFNGSVNLGDTIRGVSNTNAAIDIDGSSFVNFNDLYVENDGYFVVWIHNASSHLNFDGCTLIGDSTRTSSSAVIAASNSATSATSTGENVSHLTINDCNIMGNYYGIVINGGGTTSKYNGVTLTNNRVTNVYYYGLRVNYMDTVDVSGNSITKLRNTTSDGIYLNYSDNASVLSNEVYGATRSGLYMAYSNYVNPSPGSYSVIANNMLQSDGQEGLYCYFSSYLDVYHNSVMVNTSASGRAFYVTGSATLNTDVDIRNNIFENNGSGKAFDLIVEPANLSVDYNLYYSNGDISHDGATLAAWQTAEPTWNQNSVEGTVSSFVSTSDLHAKGTQPNDIGDNSAGITTDFDGDLRPASGSTAVDLGADEYTPVNYDVAAEMIIQPANGTCADSNTTVSVVFSNQGYLDASNFGVTINVGGAATATMAGTYTGTLTSLESDTITLGTFNSVMGGTFNIEGVINFTGDQNAENDTIRKSINLIDLLVRTPDAKYDSVCAGQYDTLYWPSNTSGMFLQWETANGDSLSTNDTLVVGPLGSNDTTFLLTEIAKQGVVGAPNTGIGPSGASWNLGYGLVFDATVTTTITSVDIYPTGMGNMEFIIDDASGNPVASVIVPITGGSATVPFTATLNLTVPPGSGYVLHPGAASTTQAIRNNIGASYPYEVPGMLSITGHSFNNGLGSYYYYFYNWQITSSGCPRPDGSITLYNGGGSLTPAFTETLQNPTQTNMVVDFDASSSVGATSYSWNFGDGNTGSGMTTSHTYDTNGTYTVTLVITGTCGTDSISKTITVSGIGLEENALSRSMNVYPNPAHTVLNIQFETLNQNAVIRITDVAGKEVMRFDENNINKYFSKTVDISKLSNGIYMLEISDDNLSAVRRLIKE